MSEVFAIIAAKYNYLGYIVLMMIGLYALIAKKNLVKKIIGMSIFQTAVILYYVSTAYKDGATIPILTHEASHGDAHGHGEALIRAADYINPLPHVLMLTAIVVSVATLGVALALAIRIYERHQTLEEDQILDRLKET